MTGNPDLIAYVNGEFERLSQAQLSIMDHATQYGDAVFEGLGVFGRRVYALEEHVDRLWYSMKYCRMRPPMSPEGAIDIVLETVKRNRLETGYLRLLVSRGTGPLGLEFTKEIERPTVLIIPQVRRKYSDEQRLNTGLTAIITRTRRTPPEVFDPRVKSCNYLNNLMAKFEQWDAGVDAGIMLDMTGCVAEAAAENIFVVRDDHLLTPRPTHILNGITRQKVIGLARADGFQVSETSLTPYDLYMADEVFLTATLSQICPIIEVDRRPVGARVPGPVAKKMLFRLRDDMAAAAHVAF